MKQVSWYRQLGLALSLFILGTLAYWLEYKHKPDQETLDEQAKKPLHVAATPVQTATVSGNGTSVTVNCADFAEKKCKAGDQSKWEISDPKPVKADTGSVNALLNAVANLNPTDVIDLKDETPEKRAALFKDYGLDPESMKTNRRVELTTAEGKSTLYLGGTHPIGEGIFAFSDIKGKETTVFVVPGFFKSQFEHDLTFWRDKKLFSVNAYEVDSFDLSTPKATITAARDHGHWVVHSGSETYEGEVESIDQLLAAATGLTAKGFVGEDLSDAKVKTLMKKLTKVLTLTIVQESAKKASPASEGEAAEDKVAEDKDSVASKTVLTLYQEKNFDPKSKTVAPVYASVSGLKPFYEVEFGVRNRLDKSVSDLRISRLITPVDKFSAHHLTFAGTLIGEAPLTLDKKEEKWSSGSDEIAPEKVQALLDQLSSTKAKEFLSGKSYPPGEKNGVEFTLADDKNEARRKYLLWINDTKLYARDLKNERKEAYLLDPAIEKAFPWNKDFFKKGEPPKTVTPDPAPQ